MAQAKGVAMAWNKLVLDITLDSISEVAAPRFFETERGFAARLYAAMVVRFEDEGLTTRGRILEMEYQKRAANHRMEQRPDMIYHIPSEYSGAPRNKNNYAVWAFKLRATKKNCMEDFQKLDEMFLKLDYPLGFFINIGDSYDWLEQYPGPFARRLYGIGVRLVDQRAAWNIRWCNQVMLALEKEKAHASAMGKQRRRS